jgi:alkylation response protein AidB-like acyl-CoA dehydrogenase
MPSTRGLNFYLADPYLQQLCASLMDGPTLERARPHLLALGELAGGELDALATEADRHAPVLRTHDARGARVDEIAFHPANRRMEELAFARFGLAAMSHRPGVLGWPTPVPHLVKYALTYLFAQSEFGLLCPVNMTDSAARMLRHYASAELRDAYLPGLIATDLAALRQGTQWMTERTGGSDVGAATTIARRGGDGQWRLWGDKWFCSNASCDLALTLARPEGAPAGTRGLAMFLVPRRLPDGGRNAWTINRLKDKLGSRSMATGEVTYAGALAFPVGPLDRGFRQMMEMVNLSRLSNALRAAGLMRRAWLESMVHARGRLAFGRPLSALPLLRSILLGMLLDSEAAIAVVLHAAADLDRADAGDRDARALLRISTPLAKYWLTAHARTVASEAMNVRGGNGYVEEWVNARLVRDSHLGAIWEGASNVVALDVQRAILREASHEPLLALVAARLGAVAEPGAKPAVDLARAAAEALRQRIAAWPSLPEEERQLESRPVADALFHVLAASLLLAEGQAALARTDDARSLLAAGLYARRWLRPAAPWSPRFSAAETAWLDDLVDWRPVGRPALEVLAGG